MTIDGPKALRESEKLRVFVALALEPDARAALIRAGIDLRREPWAKDVRWVRAQSLHLTLRFLGEIAADRVPGLLDSLGERLRDLEPFSFTLCGLSLFPSPARPRAVAAQLTAERTLAELAAAVEEAVVVAGHPAETRRFRAHITLGRFRRKGPRGLEFSASMEEISVAVNDVVLLRSALGPGGARYSELGRVALAALANS